MRVICLAVLAVAACADTDTPEPDYTSLGNFDTATLSIITRKDTLEVVAEVAATAEQKQLGLMERRQLGPNHGMLFVYDSVQDATASFWMYRTRIPLDIAFIDSAGRIASVLTMQPCESPNPQLCPTYPANARFKYALEVNAGYFARHNVGPGDAIRGDRIKE